MAEQSRLERKKAIARQSVIEYEDRLSNEELQLLRLDAIPEEIREDGHNEVYEETQARIERLRHIIDAMREAGPEQSKNRAERRARGAKASSAKPA